MFCSSDDQKESKTPQSLASDNKKNLFPPVPTVAQLRWRAQGFCDGKTVAQHVWAWHQTISDCDAALGIDFGDGGLVS